jgi:uncharacterized membrane protein
MHVRRRAGLDVGSVIGMEMGATRHINQPADEVFRFFADAANNPLWQSGMRSCTWTSEPPIGVGSTYEQHARFMGKNVRSTFVVTVYEPGRRITIKSVESTFPIEVDRAVAPTGPESCRVTAVITGRPEGTIAGLVGPFVGRMAQNLIDRDYDRLVEVLESDAHL